MGLSEQEQKRYTRQVMIEGWGEAGQKKLKDSTVHRRRWRDFGRDAAEY